MVRDSGPSDDQCMVCDLRNVVRSLKIDTYYLSNIFLVNQHVSCTNNKVKHASGLSSRLFKMVQHPYVMI